jgi:hypothetical protein
MKIVAKVGVNSVQLKDTLMYLPGRHNTLIHTQRFAATRSVALHNIKK